MEKWIGPSQKKCALPMSVAIYGCEVHQFRNLYKKGRRSPPVCQDDRLLMRHSTLSPAINEDRRASTVDHFK